MVQVGDTVFVTPVNGQKNYIAVITGPGGAGGAAGEAGGMNSYWTELVAHLKYFSNLERSYVLESPAAIGHIVTIEEVLKTVEFIGLPGTCNTTLEGFSIRGMVKTCTRDGSKQYNMGLSLCLFTSEHTKGEVLPSGSDPTDFSDCLYGVVKYGHDNGSYHCKDSYLNNSSSGACNEAPDFTNQTLYLQALLWSNVYWVSGGKPADCTAYVKDIRIGGIVQYDKGLHILDSGTATTVTETVITDTSQSWALHKWVGDTVEISSGSAFGTQAVITASDVTSVTCADATFVTDGMLVGDDFDING